MRLEDNEKHDGVVLIVIALLAVGVVAMVGLVVDIFALRTSRSAQNTNTSVAASASISAYQISTDHPAERLEAARQAAEKVTNVNFTFSLGKPLAVDPNATVPIGNLEDVDSTNDRNPLSPGIWHFLPTWNLPYFDPLTHTCLKATCPCDNGKWKGPCFETVDITDPSRTEDEVNKAINAMNLGVTLDQGNALKSMFMQTVGHKSSSLSTRATVAVRPLRVVFLVDLSRASAWETHLPYEIVGGGSLPNWAPAEYAFKLTSTSCAGTDSPYLTFRPSPSFSATNLTCQTVVSSCAGLPANSTPSATNCQFAGGWFPGANSAIFNQACPRPILIPFRTVSVHPHLLHAREEFRCFPVDSYQEGSGTPQTANYLVDAYRGDTKDAHPYTGPEPLNSMIHGVKVGLDIIANRHLGSDQAAVIGFDQRADMNIRRFPMSAYDSTDFANMQALVSDSEDVVVRNSRHFFFPREDAQSNLPAALNEAARLLMSEPDYPAAENHVILLTDGLSSCHTDAGGNNVCRMDTVSVRDGIDDAINVVTQDYVPNDIHLSVMLFGNLSGPHELVRKGSGSRSCMAGADATEANLPFTGFEKDSPDPSNTWLQDAMNSKSVTSAGMTFTVPFFYPNKLANAALASGGVWGPVRSPCAPTGAQLNGKTCAAGGLNEYLAGRCNGQSGYGDLVRNEPGITDAQGRMSCDPSCRTRSNQVEQYIAAALNSTHKVVTVSTGQ
ncbi:MAG: hypothetical protein U0136_16590 [Bdellovibrionota bacterium]